jgi:membrane protease subunit HflC
MIAFVNNRVAIVGILILVGGYLTVANCVMVVDETEQVVLTAFGEPVGDAITEPGLTFVLPWYKQRRFSKRLLRWDGHRSQIPTKDKRFIWVDTAARWKILDPLKFLQSVSTYAGAQTRLDDVIDSVVRQTLSEAKLIEAVRSESAARLPTMSTQTYAELQIERGRILLQNKMTERSTKITEREYGIQIADVRLKRINYIDEVRANIFARMVAERKKVAEQYRSQGQGRAAEILGKMERELKEIRSEAFRKAREIEGRADAEAARIFAEAYSADPEFYAFIESLDAYQKSIGRKKDQRVRFVLGTDAAFLRYLGDGPTLPAKSAAAPTAGR